MTKKNWVNAISIYGILYTVLTIYISFANLRIGNFGDSLGFVFNIYRLFYVFILVFAYELCTKLPVKNLFIRFVVAYILSVLLLVIYYGFYKWDSKGVIVSTGDFYDEWIAFTIYFGIFILIYGISLIVIWYKSKKVIDKK